MMVGVLLFPFSVRCAWRYLCYASCSSALADTGGWLPVLPVRFSSSVSSMWWLTDTWQFNGFPTSMSLLLVVVDGLPIYLVIAKAVATALLYPIKDIGDAIVYVLVGVVILGCKEFVLHSTLLQIGLYGSLEIFCSVHIRCC